MPGIEKVSFADLLVFVTFQNVEQDFFARPLVNGQKAHDHIAILIEFKSSLEAVEHSFHQIPDAVREFLEFLSDHFVQLGRLESDSSTTNCREECLQLDF